MRYEILGSLRVIDDLAVVPVSAPKMQVLLAALLIRANRVVPRDELTNEIWGSAPPRRATASLHVHVSQLRKILTRPGRSGTPIATTAPGYVLRLAPGELDLHRFQCLLQDGRRAARSGNHERAVDLLGAALSLHRGAVLDGVAGGPVVGGCARWAEEVRIECAELFVTSGIALGRHQEMAGVLRSLLARHPLHEAFYRQLMLCMFRSGRRAEALRTYHCARDAIRQELGIEPSRELRELQRTILLADGAPRDMQLAG
ncbi:BTAD domain-containing putative transcriptional regulator [Streptomyces sp. NPDC014733]|uniref:AfsR/SARP family transcriptional regulator n=1 Tax=Streptomyces sp. NPDC014733 TaxID=3364885 RepID=UPI00370068B4